MPAYAAASPPRKWFTGDVRTKRIINGDGCVTDEF